MKADGHTGKDIAKYLGVSRATLGGHDVEVVGQVSAMLWPGQTLFPSSSQFATTFLLGCTRGGSPGIFG